MVGCKILQAEHQGIYVLKFVGEIRLNLCSTLDYLIDRMKENERFITVVIDLSEATVVDSTTLGLIAKIGIYARKNYKILPTIISTNPDVSRLVDSMGFDELFIILEKAATTIEHLAEVPILQASEVEVREKVLAAHKILMDLNENNRTAFKDLVEALELEQQASTSHSH